MFTMGVNHDTPHVYGLDEAIRIRDHTLKKTVLISVARSLGISLHNWSQRHIPPEAMMLGSPHGSHSVTHAFAYRSLLLHILVLPSAMGMF